MVLADASPTRGLEPGTPAPAFSLPTASGDTCSLEALHERGLPIVLIFIDSGCGSCVELHPHLRRWQRALRDRLSIAVVARGDASAATALAEQHGVTDVLVDTGPEPLSARFRIQSAPSAVVVDGSGEVATRPARGADAIEELVRQTLKRAQDAETWKQPSPIG
jgi:peroxiredoxin